MDTFLLGLIAATLRVATPLIFGTLGELFCERAGILNLGIEGTMLFGSFVGFAAASASGSLWVGVLAALIAGGLCGLLMGLFTVKLGVNQHVSGLGITLLLTGLSYFAFRLIYGQQSIPPSIDPFNTIPVFGKLPILGVIFDQYALTYLSFLLIPVIWWIIYRSNFGLYIRAVGENPEAADAAGSQRLPHALYFPGNWGWFDGGGRGFPLAGPVGLLHLWHRQWPRLGVYCPDHFRQLGADPGDVGGAAVRPGICLAAAPAIDRVETALRGLPGSAIPGDDCRVGPVWPGHVCALGYFETV